jgi:hypothetical protein
MGVVSVVWPARGKEKWRKEREENEAERRRQALPRERKGLRRE